MPNPSISLPFAILFPIVCFGFFITNFGGVSGRSVDGVIDCGGLFPIADVVLDIDLTFCVRTHLGIFYMMFTRWLCKGDCLGGMSPRVGWKSGVHPLLATRVAHLRCSCSGFNCQNSCKHPCQEHAPKKHQNRERSLLAHEFDSSTSPSILTRSGTQSEAHVFHN